jgi:hypothetical protein
MERARQFWSAFKDIVIVFSFVVNVILLLVVFVLLTQYVTIKDQVSGLVTGLDSSFASLGEATISTTIPINQQLPVKFDLPASLSAAESGYHRDDRRATRHQHDGQPVAGTVGRSRACDAQLADGHAAPRATEPEHPGEHHRGGEPTLPSV